MRRLVKKLIETETVSYNAPCFSLQLRSWAEYRLSKGWTSEFSALQLKVIAKHHYKIQQAVNETLTEMDRHNVESSIIY